MSIIDRIVKRYASTGANYVNILDPYGRKQVTLVLGQKRFSLDSSMVDELRANRLFSLKITKAVQTNQARKRKSGPESWLLDITSAAEYDALETMLHNRPDVVVALQAAQELQCPYPRVKKMRPRQRRRGLKSTL